MIEIKEIFSKESSENDTPSRIRRTLASFGIPRIEMQTPRIGPVVTAYPFHMPNGIPLSKVLNKEEEIALALNVESVDIQREGGEIIVYVPNANREIIDFKNALFWYLQDARVREMQLPILLGQSASGENAVIDLANAPHILIAGSTGSGKSIFESSIIGCLSMLYAEDELELLLVDTKKLDLVRFDGLPNVKVIARELNEWYLLITKLIREVDRRNGLIASVGARNIKEYNERSDSRLPYTVLIIDEFADLAQRDRELRNGNKEFPEPKVDLALGRLTQIARASGIHVILCTQRSSVKVIYGDLKANFPTRIALRLPTAMDSRTILDEKGAENLLGKGDMLVKTQESDELQRYHAPFVRLEDIDAVLNQRDMILEQLNRKRLGE